MTAGVLQVLTAGGGYAFYNAGLATAIPDAALYGSLAPTKDLLVELQLIGSEPQLPSLGRVLFPLMSPAMFFESVFHCCVNRYDPLARTWATVANMSLPRVEHQVMTCSWQP